MEYWTVGRRTKAAKIRVDYVPEFISQTLNQRTYLNKAMLDFSHPGQPRDNAFADPFSGRLRDECLNTRWF